MGQPASKGIGKSLAGKLFNKTKACEIVFLKEQADCTGNRESDHEQEELKMTKESKSCRWCEDSKSELILFSKSKKKIVGFCSEECWQSFSEILFNDVCSQCNKKARLLSVSAANKDDLIDEEFSQYCDNCFQNTQNSERSDKKTTATQPPERFIQFQSGAE